MSAPHLPTSPRHRRYQRCLLALLCSAWLSLSQAQDASAVRHSIHVGPDPAATAGDDDVAAATTIAVDDGQASAATRADANADAEAAASAIANDDTQTNVAATELDPTELTLTKADAADLRQLERLVSASVQKLVDGMDKLEGQGPHIRVQSVQIDTRGIATIDFNQDLIPRDSSFENGPPGYMPADFEDFSHAISTHVSTMLQGVIPYLGTKLKADGKPVLEHFLGKLPPISPDTTTAGDDDVAAATAIAVDDGQASAATRADANADTEVAASAIANDDTQSDVAAAELNPADFSLTKADAADLRQLEHLVGASVQKLVDDMDKLEGQGPHIRVLFVRIDTGGTVTIAFNQDLIPRDSSFENGPPGYMPADFEDFSHAISTHVSTMLEDVIPYEGIELEVDGKPVLEHFLGKLPPIPPGTTSLRPQAAGRTVVISAGHGIYYHYGYKDWHPQRDPSHGITEDFITPGYATALGTWLKRRSQVGIEFPRSRSPVLHPRSKQPWWRMAARYHLQSRFPNNKEIWMAAKNRKKNDRERDDDILSRPRFANHIRADALLSLHTNAAAKNSSARGTRAYYYPGHTAGRALANNVLCYMKELIHAQPAYSNFPVRSSADKNNRHAENRDAKMPAAVIEIGFHTNASDAAALRDTNFRAAAMKGVEKGYRLFRAGRTGCQPFMTQNIPDASGRFNVYFHAPARYREYPQFPVKVETKNIYCAPG